MAAISLLESSPQTSKEKKRPIAELRVAEIPLLNISISFDYNEKLNEYRRDFEERQAKIQPSPQIPPMNFTQWPILGMGRFGTVRLMKMDNGDVCAIKILLKENLVKENVVAKTLMEKTILAASNFPFILSLLFSSKDNDYLYMGLPFAGGSDLFAYHRKRIKFPESTTRFYAAQILLALEYLHNVKCLYRDLKLENVLMEGNGYIKLADFGLSKFIDDRTTTLCGTPEYLAPEMLQVQPYGFSVDWWTLGVLIFELVAGNTPFYKYTDNLTRMYSKICKGDFDIPSSFSVDLKNLLQGLLDVRVATRLGCLCNGVKDIKSHNFFQSTNWRSLLTQNVPAPFRPRLLHPGDITYFNKISNSKLNTLHRRSNKDLYTDLFADF